MDWSFIQKYAPMYVEAAGLTLRIGIIGTGGIAHSHMRSYLQMDDVEIVGASDIVPGKARAFLDEFELNDVPAFENNAELLKLDLDGVSVCTYNTTHHICACEAMEAGVNVLCEKPMSVTLEQAVEMARTQKKTGKILTIGFQPRYGANMRMVKELVRSGELGRVYYVQTGGGRRRGIPGGTFVDKKLAGVGCLADIGCYALDMALNTVGYKRPVTVSAYSSDFFGKNPKYYNKGPFDVDDFSCALVRFEDDGAGFPHELGHAHGHDGRYVVPGHRGRPQGQVSQPAPELGRRMGWRHWRGLHVPRYRR